MHTRVFSYVLPVTALGLVIACAPQEKDSEAPKTVAPEAKPSSQPASQPSSQPSSQAAGGEKPADHPSTKKPVTLAEIFKMPETESDIVIQIGKHTVDRKALEAKLRLLQIQLTAAGMPDDLNRQAVLHGAISQLTEPVLMAQVASDLGLKLDKKLYRKSLNELNQRIKKDEHFKAFLKQAGNTPEQRKRDIRDATLDMQVRMHLTQIVKTETATSVADYYEKNKKDFIERGGRESWRIFIRAPQGLPDRDREASRLKAKSIHEKAVKNVKGFEGLARLHSEGGKGASGGHIGWVSKGTFAEKLDNQIVNAKPNSILPLYDDASGFYIYKIGGQRKERVKTLKEVEEQIFKRMFRRVLEQKIRTKLSDLKKRITIEIKIPELETTKTSSK